jgi:hypothetical protein
MARAGRRRSGRMGREREVRRCVGRMGIAAVLRASSVAERGLSTL